jgi:hypothetical protein
MTRSPLFYPLNRGMDAEAGGVADLQTDVMRFIAILALCLVAIFALVQSIPLLPTIESAVIPPAEKTEAIPEPQDIERTPRELTPPIIEESGPPPVPIEEKPLFITRTAPQRPPKRQAPQSIIGQTIAPQAVSEPPKTEEILQPVNEAAAPQTVGFTLRFETDLALTRLVARNEVGLYAITPERSLRMNVNRGSLSFWPASVPNEFHEMDEGTVPEDVLAALRRAGSVKTADVKWGVTLPGNMRSKLDGFLREHQGGSLIISGEGSLRLEP